MAAVLERFGEFVGEATCRGRLYRIGRYPGVVPSDDPTDLVHGEVYRLINPFLTLSRLDRYEECGPGFRKPTEYVRLRQLVRVSRGETLSAWVYVFNRPTKFLKRIPNGDFIEKEARP